MKLLNKITVKTVLGRTPTAALLGEEKHIDLITVYGDIRTRKEGVHTFGDGAKESSYVKFFGDIRAVRVLDGVEFRSGTLILPHIAEGVLDAVVQGVDAEHNETVRFAFGLGIQEDATAARGYVFTAEPLMESTEVDPLEGLRVQLAGKPGIPALEKPAENVADIKDAKTASPETAAPKKQTAKK